MKNNFDHLNSILSEKGLFEGLNFCTNYCLIKIIMSHLFEGVTMQNLTC